MLSKYVMETVVYDGMYYGDGVKRGGIASRRGSEGAAVQGGRWKVEGEVVDGRFVGMLSRWVRDPGIE